MNTANRVPPVPSRWLPQIQYKIFSLVKKTVYPNKNYGKAKSLGGVHRLKCKYRLFLIEWRFILIFLFHKTLHIMWRDLGHFEKVGNSSFKIVGYPLFLNCSYASNLFKNMKSNFRETSLVLMDILEKDSLS